MLANEKSLSAQNQVPRKPILLRPTRIIFYLIFSFAFLFSGFITIIDVIPYRMGLITILVIPLFLVYGIRYDRVFIGFVALSFVVMISAVINGSTIVELVYFMRTIIFSYLTYYLAINYINSNNVVQVFRASLFVAVIQLPIVVFQKLAYEYLPNSIRADISYFDFQFGTFNYKGDTPMTFFLILATIFLLFDQERNYFVRHKVPMAIWLSATIILANSESSKLIIAFIWVVYAFYRFRPENMMLFFISTSLILLILIFTGSFDSIINNLEFAVRSNTTSNTETRFLEGGYGRGSAIRYYLSEDLKIIGDGPSRYYDPITRRYILGNTGHIFTFYSEIGILGFGISYVILYLIIKSRQNHLSVSVRDYLIFFTVIAISFIVHVMNDISVVLALCIFSSAHLIQPKPKYFILRK